MVCSMSDPASLATSVGAGCSAVLPATSFDAAAVGLVAGSRAWVVLVVAAICHYPPELHPELRYLVRLAHACSNPQSHAGNLLCKVRVMLVSQFIGCFCIG